MEYDQFQNRRGMQIPQCGAYPALRYRNALGHMNKMPHMGIQQADFSQMIMPDGMMQMVNTQYMNDYLTQQVGRHVEVDFLIGTGDMVRKKGVLIKVGTNYVVIAEEGTADHLVCDFYSIKFIRVRP